MANYKIVNKQEGMLAKKAVRKTYDTEESTDKKAFIREAIQKEVFDEQDAIADNAKMISLLTTVMSRLYDILPAADKDNLAANDKAVIEQVFTKFKTTETRADVQFAIEGPTLIDKLLNRQGAIGNIIKNA